jgi:hypothetical protein
MKADRVVFVREFTEHIQCIEGRSIFARIRKLEKIGDVLESGGVPEMPLDKERLRLAVDRWGSDERLIQLAVWYALEVDRVCYDRPAA